MCYQPIQRGHRWIESGLLGHGEAPECCVQDIQAQHETISEQLGKAKCAQLASKMPEHLTCQDLGRYCHPWYYSWIGSWFPLWPTYLSGLKPSTRGTLIRRDWNGAASRVIMMCTPWYTVRMHMYAMCRLMYWKYTNIFFIYTSRMFDLDKQMRQWQLVYQKWLIAKKKTFSRFDAAPLSLPPASSQEDQKRCAST